MKCYLKVYLDVFVDDLSRVVVDQADLDAGCSDVNAQDVVGELVFRRLL